MKLNTQDRTFQSNLPDLAPKAFQIAATAKAFQILSDGLYKDKVLAMVRELFANAWDAHVEADNINTPIYVHAPTTLEPYFEIKDFGIGLSEEAIYALYTTYFASDKTHTDDLIGGYGLGSKSPFAYTDQYMVSSRFEGAESTYNIFISDRGVPQVCLTNQTPTIEHNGLTVRVAVSDKDVNEFKNTLNTSLAFYPHRPDINIEIKEWKYWNEVILPNGSVLKMLEKEQYSGYNDGTIIQGHVPYPISRQEIRNILGTELADMSSTFAATHIFVPINTFEVTANREQISFSVETKKRIKIFAKEAFEILKTQTKANYSALNTTVEKIKFLINMPYMEPYPSIRRILREEDKNLEYHCTDSDITFIQLRRPFRGNRMGVIGSTDDEFNLYSGLQTSPDGKWYWMEKKRAYRIFLEKELEDEKFTLPSYLLIGEEANIRAYCDSTGLNFNKFIYIPKQINSKTKKNYGAITSSFEYTYGNMSSFHKVGKSTINDLLKTHRASNMCIVSSNDSEILAVVNHLRTATSLGIISDALWIVVSSSHSVVHSKLIEQGAQVYTYGTSLPPAFIQNFDSFDESQLILLTAENRVSKALNTLVESVEKTNKLNTESDLFDIVEKKIPILGKAYRDILTLKQKWDLNLSSLAYTTDRPIYTHIQTLANKKAVNKVIREELREIKRLEGVLIRMEKKYGSWIYNFGVICSQYDIGHWYKKDKEIVNNFFNEIFQWTPRRRI